MKDEKTSQTPNGRKDPASGYPDKNPGQGIPHKDPKDVTPQSDKRKK